MRIVSCCTHTRLPPRKGLRWITRELTSSNSIQHWHCSDNCIERTRSHIDYLLDRQAQVSSGTQDRDCQHIFRRSFEPTGADTLAVSDTGISVRQQRERTRIDFIVGPTARIAGALISTGEWRRGTRCSAWDSAGRGAGCCTRCDRRRCLQILAASSSKDSHNLPNA